MVPDQQLKLENEHEFTWVQIDPVPDQEKTDHPEYESVVVPVNNEESNLNISAVLFDNLRGGRCEADYYLHIANNGYTYESCLAFMPLYPLLARLTTDMMYNLYSHQSWMTSLVPFTFLLQCSTCLIGTVFFLLANDR